MSRQVVLGLSELLEAEQFPSLQVENLQPFTYILQTVIARAREQLEAPLSRQTPDQTSPEDSDQQPPEQDFFQTPPAHPETTAMWLRDFACTMVGCVVSDHGGFFFHIGDGFAIHQQALGAAQLSLPENGEYADETYFVTDPNWREHLRIIPIQPLAPDSLIGLMSDGPAPFAVNKTKTAFYLPFIEPVMRFLRAVPESEGCLALKNLLEDEKTHHITGDDKSLLLAFKS